VGLHPLVKARVAIGRMVSLPLNRDSGLTWLHNAEINAMFEFYGSFVVSAYRESSHSILLLDLYKSNVGHEGKYKSTLATALQYTIRSFILVKKSSIMSLKFLLWCSIAVLAHANPLRPIHSRNDSFPYELLKKSCINSDCSATRLSVSNPPINLWNAQLIQEFNAYLLSINNTASTTPKVVVISSDVPDFYIAQIDLHLLSVAHPAPDTVNVTDTLNKYYENLSLLSSIPVIFVAEITGRAWGAGDEHLMHMDMRFAGPDALFSAPEAAVGIIHVGALQWLVESVGPSLTMEYMLSSAQINATEAARIGWVNSAYTTTEALRDHIDTLVTRIAKFEVDGLRATKKSIAQQKPTQEMFEKDQATFGELASAPSVQAAVDRILDLSDDQGKAWELNNSDNIVEYID